MSEMNSTAEVSQPIQAGGGESPVSWDQLESVSNFKAEVAKNDAKTELQAEAEAKKELGAKEPTKKASKADNDAEPDAKPVKAKEDAKADAAKNPETKKLKLKHDEQDLEIPLDVKVPVKIDGKVEQVSLSEALARYSQQKHLDKIYQDYKKEKAAFEQERGKMKSMVNTVHETLVKNKDMRGFIEAIAEPLGLDPSKIYEETISQMESKFEEAQSLSPEERKAKALEEELAYYRRKQETAKQQETATKVQKELESKVESVIAETGMDKAAFVKSYDELIKLGFDAAQLTPEQIGSYYRNMQTITQVESKLAAKNPELAQDAALIEKLATLAIQNQATPDEIDAVIEQLYSSDAEKKLTKKINKSMRKASAETPVKNPGKDPLFFDDI
jgi:hypothetical protein